MAKTRPEEAVTALRRFGLGARPGDIAAIAADPRGYVRSALTAQASVLLDDPDLDASNIALANAQLAQRQRRLERESAQEALREATKVPYRGTGGQPPTEPMKQRGFARPGMMRAAVYQDEAAVRFERMVTAPHGFLERLVLYWSNHFCVSATKNPVRPIAGAFEREAIRPHVLGRFADMLLAVESHPAMLIYLDNQLSIGPNSVAGRARNRGLNENLAREILELHTLGVDGGYAQTDVTNLARILTGWSVGGLNLAENAGRFVYLPQRREPGAFTVAGKSYTNNGEAAGRSVLLDLARHPSTARNVARRMATHFVADPPPPDLVARLEKSFRDTDGDLGALARALIEADAAWTAPATKLTPPNDFLVALVRALPFRQRPRSAEIVRLSRELGQPLWEVPSPKGWPETNDAWAGPSALRERLRIAEQAAGQLERTTDPRAVAEDVLGPTMSDATRQAIARAETHAQGFVLLAMSPEMQRR